MNISADELILLNLDRVMFLIMLFVSILLYSQSYECVAGSLCLLFPQSISLSNSLFDVYTSLLQF